MAELPFDTAYKLMATFHRMTDEAGTRGRPLLRQGRARPAARPRASRTWTRTLRGRPSTTTSRDRYLAENERLAAQGLRVMATARKDFDAGDASTPAPTCCS